MKKLFIYTLMISNLLLAQGCGKGAKARIQPIEIIDVPEFPVFKDNVYGLTPAKSSIGYGGTMVILNKQIDSADLADLLQASVDSRIAWAEARKFTEETNYALKYSEGGIYETALEDMKAQLKIFEAEAKAKLTLPQETLELTAKSWLKDELELLFANDEVGKSNATAVFDRYCEAKVWELATNSYFALNTYESRPSPMAFCKSFYESAGFFKGSACTDGDSSKNYFSCLWDSGVKLTSFYREYSIEEISEIETLLTEENMSGIRDILGIHEPAFTFPSPIYKSRTIGKNKENRDYFSKIILQQSQGSRLCERVIPEFSKLCTVFEKSTVSNQDPMSMSPADIIATVEGTNAEKSSLFSLPNRPNSIVTTKEILAYLALRQKHENSELDRIFHKVVEGEKLVKPTHDEVLAEKGSAIESILTGQLYPALSGDDLAVFEKKKDQIATLEKDYNQKNEVYTNFNQRITDTSDNAFKIGNRPNVALAFMEVRLKVSNRDGVLRAYHWIKDSEGVAVLGCLDMKTKQSLTERCRPHPDDGIEASTFQKAKFFSINDVTGLVEFEVLLNDPEPLGYKMKDRVSGSDIVDSFSDLSAKDFLGKTLYFELYPNIVFDHMEILSGKAFLRNGIIDVEEAAVSFWDQNL